MLVYISKYVGDKVWEKYGDLLEKLLNDGETREDTLWMLVYISEHAGDKVWEKGFYDVLKRNINILVDGVKSWWGLVSPSFYLLHTIASKDRKIAYEISEKIKVIDAHLHFKFLTMFHNAKEPTQSPPPELIELMKNNEEVKRWVEENICKKNTHSLARFLNDEDELIKTIKPPEGKIPKPVLKFLNKEHQDELFSLLESSDKLMKRNLGIELYGAVVRGNKVGVIEFEVYEFSSFASESTEILINFDVFDYFKTKPSQYKERLAECIKEIWLRYREKKGDKTRKLTGVKLYVLLKNMNMTPGQNTTIPVEGKSLELPIALLVALIALKI